jgi:uncharacterized membrane protein YbaN (DUF454 family)
MSFNTMLDATSVKVAKTKALERMMAALPMIGPTTRAKPGPGQGTQRKPQARAAVGVGGWIECHEASGLVAIHDPRLFRVGHEAFCGELVKVAVERHQATRAEICLRSSLCRLEFEPGRFDQRELADRATAAVRAATPSVRDGSGSPRNPRGSWTTLTAFATPAGASVWETREEQPGQVIFFNRAFEASAVVHDALDAPAGAIRLSDLALAGGSLMLAAAGLVLPGIPSLPFLVLTGHYAVRLSPTLRRFLTRQPWFAPLVAEVERLECLRGLDRRSILKLAGIAALAVAVFLIIHPPLPVVLALEFGLMAFLCYRKMGRSGPVALGLAA